MDDVTPAEDFATTLLERRWFAAGRAAAATQAECDALAHALELTRCAWRESRQRLLRIEALRDTLADELAAAGGAGIHRELPAGQRSAA